MQPAHGPLEPWLWPQGTWQRAEHARNMLHAALGLGDGSLAKPLLWRRCGHPQLAASLQQTAQLGSIMQDLCSPRWACEPLPSSLLAGAAVYRCACARSQAVGCCRKATCLQYHLCTLACGQRVVGHDMRLGMKVWPT